MIEGVLIMAVSDEVKKMRVRAWDAHWRGENLDAIRLCNELLKIDPNPGLVYSYRAAAYVGLKDYARAIDDGNRAVELNPKYSEAYNNRGWAYFESGDYDRAISDFSKAIERRKNNHIAYTNRAAAYFELNDCTRAIDDCNKALELQPNYAPALKLLASLHVKAKE